MNIYTDKPVMVFKNINDGKVTYKVGISNKVQDENGNTKYINDYFPIRFKKSTEPENERTKINIVKGFLTFSKYEDKDGNSQTFRYIMVMDYSEVEEQKQTTSIKQDEIEISEFDLPF